LDGVSEGESSSEVRVDSLSVNVSDIPSVTSLEINASTDLWRPGSSPTSDVSLGDHIV